MANNSKVAGHPAACCLDPYIPSFEQRIGCVTPTFGTVPATFGESGTETPTKALGERNGNR